MAARKMKSTISIFIFITTMVQHISGGGVYVYVNQGILAGEFVKGITGEYFYSFKGIPYAKPPVGKLRFKAPQKPDSWNGVRDATKHGAVCPQVVTLTNEYIPGNEDCLFLNVYTPHLAPYRPLPVLVTIPGGAYKFGSGNDDIYGPDFLVSKGVIVVTFNYRLDALGFLSMNTCEVPGNAGLKDQVAALKWVQNNIRYFGGDRNRVTIIGESAGGPAACYHMVSPMSKGLFRRAIVMSGVPPLDWNAFFEPERRAFVLGKTLGLDTKNKTELLNFLQQVPFNKLVNTTSEVIASEIKTNVLFKMVPFAPVFEIKCPKDSFITRNPTELLLQGDVNKVDVMFSYNSQEALLGLSFYEKFLLEQYSRYPELFVPTVILHNSTPKRILRLADRIIKYYFGNKTVSLENMVEFIHYANSAIMVHGIQKFFRIWPAVGNRYFFKFSSYSSRNYYGLQGARYGIIGAGHFDDIFYIYDAKSMNMPLKKNSTEYKMIQQITTAVTNFVKYGNPNPRYSLGVRWPQYTPTTRAGVEFTDRLKVIYAPDDSDYEFWESIFREAGFSY